MDEYLRILTWNDDNRYSDNIYLMHGCACCHTHVQIEPPRNYYTIKNARLYHQDCYDTASMYPPSPYPELSVLMRLYEDAAWQILRKEHEKEIIERGE